MEDTTEVVEPRRGSLAERVAAELHLPSPEDQDPGAQEMDLGSATYTKMLSRRW